jgi:hypothetical protein
MDIAEHSAHLNCVLSFPWHLPPVCLRILRRHSEWSVIYSNYRKYRSFSVLSLQLYIFVTTDICQTYPKIFTASPISKFLSTETVSILYRFRKCVHDLLQIAYIPSFQCNSFRQGGEAAINIHLFLSYLNKRISCHWKKMIGMKLQKE